MAAVGVDPGCGGPKLLVEIQGIAVVNG